MQGSSPVTPQQRLFVDEYLVDLHATQAAIRAGYSPRTAGQIGHTAHQAPVGVGRYRSGHGGQVPAHGHFGRQGPPRVGEDCVRRHPRHGDVGSRWPCPGRERGPGPGRRGCRGRGQRDGGRPGADQAGQAGGQAERTAAARRPHGRRLGWRGWHGGHRVPTRTRRVAEA